MKEKTADELFEELGYEKKEQKTNTEHIFGIIKEMVQMKTSE